MPHAGAGQAAGQGMLLGAEMPGLGKQKGRLRWGAMSPGQRQRSWGDGAGVQGQDVGGVCPWPAATNCPPVCMGKASAVWDCTRPALCELSIPALFSGEGFNPVSQFR